MVSGSFGLTNADPAFVAGAGSTASRATEAGSRTDGWWRPSSWAGIRFLPRGGLPQDAWRDRHATLLIILWLHVPALLIFGLVAEADKAHVVVTGIVAGFAALAGSHSLSSRTRTILATLGLVTCSALLVHFSGGVIEMHFHFFVVIALIALYQDWIPFLIGIGYVAFHHGVLGYFFPHEIYNHPAALANPIKWALLHAGFVLAESAACVVGWRLIERAHKETSELASIVDHHNDPIIGCTPEGVIKIANPAAQKLLGYKLGELTERRLIDLLTPTSAARVVPAFEAALSGDSPMVNVDARNHNEEEIAASMSLSPIHDSTGKVVRVAVFIRDIRHRLANEQHRKLLEERVHQMQKMEAVGQLAGGIAHDFNNLIGVIQNFSQFVIDQLDEQDPRRDDLEEVVAAAQRGANLTRQLLTFSRSEVVEPQVFSPNEVILGLERLLRRTIRESIDLSLTLSADLKDVEMDVGQMEQVLINLGVNAADAMPRGGNLRIETANVIVDGTFAQFHPGVEEGEYVKISVSDTGSGIPPELQSRIFEPFFTTKPKDQGTGLGLATCYGIVKRAGGHIYVYSELEKGTTFSIYLPAVTDRAPATTQTSDWDAPDRGHGITVLVVEDEEGIRRIAQRILSSHGYEVLAAEDPVQAIELASRHEGEISVLLTDVIMPELSGKELKEELGLPTLFMSGYTNRVVAEQGVVEAGEHFLQKPFTAKELLTKMALIVRERETAS